MAREDEFTKLIFKCYLSSTAVPRMRFDRSMRKAMPSPLRSTSANSLGSVSTSLSKSDALKGMLKNKVEDSVLTS